jgi:hypothetical protein
MKGSGKDSCKMHTLCRLSRVASADLRRQILCRKLGQAVVLLCPIVAERRQHRRVNRMPHLLDLLERPRHAHQGVERHQIRDQIVVLDELALFAPRPLREQVGAPETDLVHELVERLALVDRRLNDVAQFDAGDVAQRKDRSYHPPEFSKREVELVLAAVGRQPAQDC